MSFNEVMEALPALSVSERQQLMRRALELDNPPLPATDEALVEERLAAHHADPKSSIPLAEMKKTFGRQ